MKNIILLTLIFCLCLLTGTAQNISPLTIGQIHTLKSKFLNEERLLNIYLPEKYDSTKAYPTIYLLDGSMNEDFLHITGLVQYFNLQFTMPETIIIGIANVDRKRDFTFKTNIEDLKKDYPTTGHSDKFINFLENELKPYIQQHFKSDKNEFLIGQSLGGLVTTEILLNKPYLFSHYFIISPSLWWDDQSILKDAQLKSQSLPKHIYLSVGEKEHPIMVRDAKELNKILQKAKAKIRLHFNLMKNEDHATILHNSMYEAFKELFPVKTH